MSFEPLYDPLYSRALKACQDYLDQGEQCLAGKRRKVPDIGRVLRIAVPHGAILKAEHVLDESLFGYVNLTIQDADRNEPRSPRMFDPPYVVALILLTLPGGSLRFNDSTSKSSRKGKPENRRFYVSFGRGTNENISVLRIIYGASAGRQIHRNNLDDSSFHKDHRRHVLREIGDADVRNECKRARLSERARDHAINTACQHFKKAELKHPVAFSRFKLSQDEFRELLLRAFRVADSLSLRQMKANAS
jgi:hypothetical protein